MFIETGFLKKSELQKVFVIYLFSAVSLQWLLLKSGHGPWTQTQKNLDPEKPGPRKTWTLKNLDPEKPGP